MAKPPRKMLAISEELWWKLQEVRVELRESSLERLVEKALTDYVIAQRAKGDE